MAQFLVMFSHSVSTLGENGAKTGRRAAGGERVQLILRNAILHQADTETLCHVFGLDKEFK